MAIFSHSKIQTFEQCPYKYKLKYIYKIKPEIPKSIEAHLGTACHDTLEWLYLQVLENKIPTLDETVEQYIENWQKDFTSDILIVKTEFTHSNYFEKGLKFIIDYYAKNQPFSEKTIETEKKVWVNLGEDFPHKVIGYIDRLTFNQETSEYEIHDYKTSNWLPPQSKLDTDRQLALYSIGIKQELGSHHNINLIWHYLAHNKKVESKRTPEQLEELKQEIITQINTIESNTSWPTKKIILCNWCEYKNMCKAHGNSLPKEFQEKEGQKKLF